MLGGKNRTKQKKPHQQHKVATTERDSRQCWKTASEKGRGFNRQKGKEETPVRLFRKQG